MTYAANFVNMYMTSGLCAVRDPQGVGGDMMFDVIYMGLQLGYFYSSSESFDPVEIEMPPNISPNPGQP